MPAGSTDSASRLAAARAELEAAAAPRAAGPGADRETLRRAYLDLLKLCVCDLAGAGTTSVGALPDGRVMARELRGDDARLRAVGMDWPLHGLTMVGLRRLNDLQSCVESVVADGVEGDLIEAGAWRGGASLLIRATLDTLGAGRTVCVADSFEGFVPPNEGDADALALSAFDILSASVDDVRNTFARLDLGRGVELVAGYFEDTLPALTDRRWALVRLDADSYEATREALAWLYPGLAAGGYLIVDDYLWFDGCRRAVDEFRERHRIVEPLESVDFTCVRWRRADVSPIDHPTTGPRSARRPPAPVRDPHVPTARELELERELAAARERVAELERRGLLARLRGGRR